MNWSDWIIPGLCIALEITLLLLLVRRGTWRAFPFYAVYVLFVLIQSIAFAEIFSHYETYAYVFWITTPVEILLTILAALESFWRVFRIFKLLRWFRLVLPSAIAVSLAYSAWQGYRFPPLAYTSDDAAIINATVTSHYVILVVVLLFFFLVVLLGVSWRIHEYRFLLGFGVASLAASFGGTIRAVFGAHFDFVSREAQPIGYVVALLIWLSAVVHPVPEQRVVEAPSDEQLEAAVADLKNQLHYLRSFVRKSGR
jgi:hypothetical protein